MANELDLFSSTYNLSRENTLIGEMSRSVRKQDNTYIFLSESKTTGLIALFYKDVMKEESRWRMESSQFIPLTYRYHRSRKKKERQVDIDFDWGNGRIVTNVNGDNWSMPIEENIFDKLLYQIAIMQELKAGKPVSEFKVADGGKIKTYYFKNLGEEILDTPMGEFSTVKLERYKSNNAKKLTFWCAKDLGYLPVKVENIDKEGKTVTAVIKEYLKQ